MKLHIARRIRAFSALLVTVYIRPAAPSTGPRRLRLLFDRPLPRPPRVRMPRSAASPSPPPCVRSAPDAGFRPPPRSPTRCPMESSICGRPFRGRHASRTTASRLLCLTRFGARLLGSSASLPSYPARSLALARAIPRSPLPHRLPRCCQPSLHPRSASWWASPLLLRFRGRSRGCLGDLLPPASTSRNRPRICYMQTIGSGGSGPSMPFLAGCTSTTCTRQHTEACPCCYSNVLEIHMVTLRSRATTWTNTKPKPPYVRSTRPSNSAGVLVVVS